MKFIKTMMCVSLSSLAITSSFAQSVFEGPFVQGALGYTSVSTKFNETVSLPNNSYNPQNFSADDLSVLTGNVGVGYTFVVAPKYLVGVSIDYMPITSGSAKSQISFPNLPGNLVPNTIPGSYQMKNPLNISLMPGYEISSTQEIYAKVAYTTATVIYSDSITAATSTQMSGYTLGLGYKQALQNKLYVFAEGLYTKFQDQSTSITGPIGASSASLSVGSSGYTFLVGGGYKF
jgi:outer membrane immunogenic protein